MSKSRRNGEAKMSGCEYEQEDFCLFEDVEGFDSGCKFKDKNHHCNAKPSDLEEGCPECMKPLWLCQCLANEKKVDEVKMKINSPVATEKVKPA